MHTCTHTQTHTHTHTHTLYLYLPTYLSFFYIYITTYRGDIHDTVVVPWTVGLLVNRSSDRSCIRGMFQNKIYLISPCCLRPSIALTVQNHGLKHQSFILYILIAYRIVGFSGKDLTFMLAECIQTCHLLMLSADR